jgi:hypothetical protein
MKFYRPVIGLALAMFAFSVFVGLRTRWANFEFWGMVVGVAAIIDFIIAARHERRKSEERQFIESVSNLPPDERQRRLREYDATNR